MAHLDIRTLRRPANRRSTGALHWFLQALAARRQRQALRALPPERLRDLGITERDAHLEAVKPIWNVPAHWLR